ncbi:MAG: hypothetical protein ACXV5N_12395 [Halobacteriota archaeon]
MMTDSLVKRNTERKEPEEDLYNARMYVVFRFERCRTAILSLDSCTGFYAIDYKDLLCVRFLLVDTSLYARV